MPEEDEVQAEQEVPEKEASVDDLAATIATKLKQFQDEDQMLAEEEKTIKARRKMLKAEIDKAERMTRSLIPRTRGRKPDVDPEINPPVQQPPVQTEPVRQASAAPSFKPE